MTLPRARSLEVWFVRDGRLSETLRTHAPTRRVATAAVGALLAGPTGAERDGGLSTQIPRGTRLLGVSIENGVASVDFTSDYGAGAGSRSLQLRLAQVVYTLTQFPTVRAVRFELNGAPVNVFSSSGIVLGHPVGRSDYESLGPVVQPLAGHWRLLAPAPTTAPNRSRERLDGARAARPRSRGSRESLRGVRATHERVAQAAATAGPGRLGAVPRRVDRE